ncbi:hypothetical protein TgHK011_004167 [Trichoderma gracile]|nr:hypothetical protein TgHK011_004167 [Trichoderma gracile]
MNQLEVVNSDELEAALQEREGWQGKWPAVRVIDFCDGTIVEDYAFDVAVDLEMFLRKNPRAQLRVILLETRQVTPSSKSPWQGEVLSAAVNPSMLRCLREHAGLLNTFIEATCGIGHWYSAKHVCYDNSLSRNDKLGGHGIFDVFYEYIPQEKKHSCTQMSTDFQSTTYFFLDLPLSVLTRFTRDVAEDGKVSTRFFYLDALIADEAMRTWQKDIARKRTALKSLLNTQKSAISPSMNYTPSLENGISSLAISPTTPPSSTFSRAMLNGSLEYLDSSCRSLTYLVSDYSGRTKTRIDLLYHLTNQAESQSTRELAELARQDSAAMLTIAAVTLLFLPGTFIASILSTTIFNFADGEMQVYRKWWVFPVTVVPFTILVFVVWFAWLGQKRGGQEHRKFGSAT